MLTSSTNKINMSFAIILSTFELFFMHNSNKFPIIIMINTIYHTFHGLYQIKVFAYRNIQLKSVCNQYYVTKIARCKVKALSQNFIRQLGYLKKILSDNLTALLYSSTTLGKALARFAIVIIISYPEW